MNLLYETEEKREANSAIRPIAAGPRSRHELVSSREQLSLFRVLLEITATSAAALG
jgi:hypothetical protein